MMVEGGKISPGIVEIQTTNHRGFTPEEVAERCLSKLLRANAYKDHMRAVLVFYMKEAVKSDRTTVYNALCDAGQKDLAELIRRL
jgi:hypothetical protein